MKRQRKPRQRRLDIINDLPWGQQKEIARICGCATGYVSAVLNGYKNTDSDTARNIIRLAERAAEHQREKDALSRVKRFSGN